MPISIEASTAISSPVAYGYVGPGQISAGTASRLAVAYGPRQARTADSIVAPMTVGLYRRDGTLVATFAESLNRQFDVEVNEVGAGSLEVFNDDAGLDLLADGDLVRFIVNGQTAQAILAQEISSAVVASDEEADERTTISGPGHAAVLEEAVVYPARAFQHGPGDAEVGGYNNRRYIGVGLSPVEEDRIFSWASVDYFAGDWWPATVISPDIPTAVAWYDAHGAPDAASGFTDLTAAVLWMGGSLDGAEGGDVYLRGVITAPVAGQYVIHSLIDNWGTIYVDGQKIQETDGSSAFLSAEEASIELSAGDHLFAIKGTNATHDGANPGAVAIAVYAIDAAGDLGTLVGHTTPAWRGAKESPEPGMRVGEIMENLIIEAQARGSLGDVRIGFNWQHDSGGREWPTIVHSTRTGTDLLTVLRELSDTHLDWWMEPTSMTLHAWIKGTRGLEPDVALERGVNLLSLDITERLNATTSMLVRWNGGWHDQTVKGVTRREAMLSLGTAQTVTMVEQVAAGQIAQADDKLRTVEATIEPHPGDDPFVDFVAGDRILVLDRHGATTRELVREITTTEDEDGNLSHQLTLGAIYLEPDEALAQAVKKMTPGTMRGQSRVATPVSVNIPMGQMGRGVGGPRFTVSSQDDSMGPYYTGRSETLTAGPDNVTGFMYRLVSFSITVPAGIQVDGTPTFYRLVFRLGDQADHLYAEINLGTSHPAGTHQGTILEPDVKIGDGYGIWFEGGGQTEGFKVEATFANEGDPIQLPWTWDGHP